MAPRRMALALLPLGALFISTTALTTTSTPLTMIPTTRAATTQAATTTTTLPPYPTKYLFTIPREVAAGSNETFCIDVHKIPSGGLDVSVSLLEAKPSNSNDRPPFRPWFGRAPWISTTSGSTTTTTTPTRTVYASQKLVVTYDGRACAELAIPRDIAERRPAIRVMGAARDGSGYAFDEERDISLKTGLTRVTFVETDKPVYKPGDLVRIRLLTVDAALKPVDDVIKIVWIENPAGVRMEQWNNVSRELGFASVEMKLSTEPAKGVWKVKAKAGGRKITRSFEVKEYVAPKFEVTINTHEFLRLDDDDIKARIFAHYTYGKRVSGKVKVRVWRTRYDREDGEPVEAEGDLDDGSHGYYYHQDINLMDLRSEWGIKYHISAEVTEKGTNVKMSAKTVIPITRRPIKIKIEELKNGYKPFIPGQAIHVKATTATDKPSSEELIRVKISKTWDQRLPEETSDELLLLEVNATTDANGVAEVPITSDLTAMARLHVEAEALTFNNGRKSLDKISNTRVISIGPTKHTRVMCLPAFHSLSVRSWFSPSNSFLKIDDPNGPVPCGETFKLPISFTTDITQGSTPPKSMYYTAVSRGKVVSQSQFLVKDPPDLVKASNTNITSWKTSLSLTVDETFAPAFNLLVYYVRADGEVVADEASITTAECLVNDVKVNFDVARRLPGEKTKVSISAAPKSLCGFSIVDKSISLMGSKNTLKKADVFKWLKKGEIGEKNFGDENHDYCRKAEAGNVETLTTRSYWRSWGRWRSDRHDSITAFRDAGILTITDMTLESRPCKQDRTPYYRVALEMDVGMAPAPMGRGLPGPRLFRKQMVGATTTTTMPMTTTTTMTMTTTTTMNANTNNNNNKKKKKQKLQEAEIRNFFPETWLWKMHRVDDSGVMTLQKKVPHTITEWQARAVCSNADVGLGVSPTESLVVFQPFFASARLPYSVIRNEKVPLKIQVFNYLKECIAVKLKIIKYRSIMKVVGPTERTICLCVRDSYTSEFQVVPGTVGKINVTVSAEALKDGSGICEPDAVLSEEAKGVKDVIIKKLLVEPEGIEMESNYGRFVCLDPNGAASELRFEDQIRLDFDAKNYVKKSALLRVSAIGDVLGPALDGLDDLLRLPTGCGEQNMLKFAPNIFVMKYLGATNQDSKEIKTKAIEFMKTGYQRELTYRHDDGSYSAFGKSDSSGSLWLTAFVVKCFGQARQFISIDQNDLDVSIKWLLRNQKPDGEFPTIGRVVHKDMKGGLSDKKFDIGLTAYTIGALVDAGLSPADRQIQTGLEFILPTNVSVLESLDSYSLWLVANTLTLVDVNHPRLQGILDLLDSRRRGDSGMGFWSDSAVGVKTVTSGDIETTAYALMTSAKLGKIDESVEMTRWLTQQRNGKGGFLSTQDTVCALQALARISEILYSRSGKFHVKFEAVNQTKEFNLNQVNRLLLHRSEMEFDEDPAKFALNVRVTPETAGCAMIQASLKYNVIKPPKNQKEVGKKSFSLKQRVSIQRNRDDHCKWRELETCLTYRGGKGPSGMVMVEVKMVSGWIPDKDSLKEVTKQSKVIKRFDVDSRMVKFYLDKLRPDVQFCFSYLVEQQIRVGNAKPGLVKVYDYYEPDVVVDQKYKIKQTCGTKMEIPYYDNAPEGPVDPSDPSTFPMQRRSDWASPENPVIGINFDDVDDGPTTTETTTM